MSDNKQEIADHKARIQALDPEKSFIVQAPAGSGKTGLLTQRFLMLLSAVEVPEEIVAITFTRKAAAEMRDRILQALEHTNSDQAPEDEHGKRTWELARKAIARDSEKGWQLLDNPNRLRILTIDSLCSGIVRQMPVLSKFGSMPATSDDSELLYLEAARMTIAELESSDAWSNSISHLIRHLDNNLSKLQGLIASMLAKRDQWLRHVASPDNPGLIRNNIENAIVRMIEAALADTAKHVPETLETELIELAQYAAGNLTGSDSPILACRDLKCLPGKTVQDCPQWQGIRELLLTAGAGWRSPAGIRATMGFPAPSGTKDKDEKALYSEMKQRMAALLESLQDNETLRDRLALIKDLPPHQYNDNEWQTLEALFELLRISAAHLELVFSSKGEVDFPALAQAAISALGEPEAPTDLALTMDHRISHLLVDEFQDTAYNQYKLIKALIAGWQSGDGRTLFVVGDPMQSIYGFREANVGLFLETKGNGKIGDLALEFLSLSVNFRSQHGVVDWVNQGFPLILSDEDDPASGAVSYARSESFHSRLDGEAVIMHPSIEKDYDDEADQVISLIQKAKAEHPDGTTAILVRGRSHLVDIVKKLQQSKIRFQAVEIEGLQHRQVVQDLSSLTRALYFPEDRIAWLSLLRAPYCGLTLADLTVLAEDDSRATMIDLLQQPDRIDSLSEDGRSRISRVLPILEAAQQDQARRSLRSYVEGVWISLGGPACVTSETDIEDAEVYFQLLEKLGEAGIIPSGQELNRRLEKLYALPDVEAPQSLQIMTMHKAKGLEFDTVILPGLGRSPGSEDRKLLYWLERDHISGSSDLLLAPVNAQGEDTNPIAAYLQRINTEKRRNENARLLYVAATRAKKRLHLLGYVGFKEKNGELTLGKPPADTLLACLWPVVENSFASLLEHYEAKDQAQGGIGENEINQNMRTRLVADWVLSEPPVSVQIISAQKDISAGEQIEFSWAGETARHVGTVVHRLLQRIGEVGIENISQENMDKFESIGRQMLLRLGVSEQYLPAAIEKTNSALQSTLNDERGQWILSSQHKNTSCELALTRMKDGVPARIIIDRTFIDDQGTRWIIDYKTSTHTGGGLDEFLDREQDRYRDQLEAYADAMKKYDGNQTRLGLYYPLMGGWREWICQT